MSSNALPSRTLARACSVWLLYVWATVLQSCSINAWYPPSASGMSMSLHTSAAISRQTGRAAEYNAVPDFDVVDAPIKESTESNALSISNDHDNKFISELKLLVLKLVFNFLAISSSVFLDADVSFVPRYASSPSVATFNAAASSFSILTVKRR